MSDATPRIGIIGGSGLGSALLASAVGMVEREVATPFGRPSGAVLVGEWEGVPIAILPRHGVGHVLPPTAVPYRANIYALKAVGCGWIIGSGAVGSLREEILPRELVVVDQLIDKTTGRNGSFFDEIGVAVHVEFAEPFCSGLRGILLEAAKDIGVKVHEKGTYVCMEGPAFSTRAESLMHRQWGGDLIGMTACPEAKLAREAEMSYALVALATDYDCWRPHEPGASKEKLLTEIIGNMHAATEHALKLVKAAIPMVWERRGERFAAHSALELGIWSDKAKISAETKAKLGLLIGKYVR